MRLLGWTCIVLRIAAAQAPPAISAEAHLKQAQTFQRAGDSRRAIAELRQALQLKPDLRDAHAILGEILLSQGFAGEAVPHLERAGHVYSRALALSELNRLPEALRLLLPLYGERPRDPELLFHLGETSGKLMQQAFDRLLRNYPGSPGARELRTRTSAGPPPAGLPNLQALDELLAAYVQSRADPDVLFRVGEESERITQHTFQSLIRLHPNSARAQELQARSYLGQGRGDLAEPLFRQALKLNPALPAVHLALGKIFSDMRGDLDGAEREFRAEIHLRPGDAEAAWRLGSVLLKKGQATEALAQLQQSDKLKPDMLETLLELGKAYLIVNQTGQAEKMYRRMIEIDDTDELTAVAHLQLSQIYRKMGDAAEADQHLKRYRELTSQKVK